MAKVLELTFLTAANKPVKLTVDEPRDVILNNIFIIEESPLATIKDARIVVRNTQTIVSR